MSYSKAALESAILDRAHTGELYFPTKQYIQAGFQVILNGKMLRDRGTGGGHSGNAGLTYKHGLKSTSADASATDIRNIMIYPALTELLKGTGLTQNKIQTSYFLRFPNLQSYRKDDNGKLKKLYFYDNPYYTPKFKNNNFTTILEKYIDTSISVDASDKEAEQCYMSVSASAMKLADKFIGYVNYAKPENEDMVEWKRIIKEKYIKGDDCVAIEDAIDWYVSNNNDVIAEFKKSASLGDDSAYGVDDTNDLLGSAPKISLSPNNILNAVPDSVKKSVKSDVSHSYTLPIKIGYSLLFLQSFAIERTNDINTSNKGIHTHQRAYVFTLIEPDNKGEYTEFPGKMQLVYTVDNVSNLTNLQPGYVYEVIPSMDEKNKIIESNPTSGRSVNSKLIGETGSGVSMVEFPNTIFRKVSGNGTKPDFTGIGEMDINEIEKNPNLTKPHALEPEKKSPTMESLMWFSGWDWKE